MFLNSGSGDVGGEGDVMIDLDLGCSTSTCVCLFLGLAGYGDTGSGLNLNGLAQKMSYRVNSKIIFEPFCFNYYAHWLPFLWAEIFFEIIKFVVIL